MKRVGWIDYGKLVGIYLVVLAHTDLFVPLKNGIYTFLMPVFFFISGYLFSFSRNPVYKDFVKKRFRQLIIPYIWINVITYFFWLLVGRHFGNDVEANIPWYEPAVNAFVGNGTKMIHDVPIWFFTCLFVVENLFYLLFKAAKRFWAVWLLLVAAAYLNYICNPYFLPFSFNTAVVGTIFYALGYVAKKRELFRKSNLLLWVLGLAIVIWVADANGRIAMYKNFYNNYFLFLLGGIGGIVWVVNTCLYLFSRFGRVGWVEYVAKNTIIISGFHALTFALIKAVMVYLLCVPLAVLEGKVGLNVLFSVISVMLCLPVIFVVNKYFPFIVGRKRQV